MPNVCPSAVSTNGRRPFAVGPECEGYRDRTGAHGKWHRQGIESALTKVVLGCGCQPCWARAGGELGCSTMTRRWHRRPHRRRLNCGNGQSKKIQHIRANQNRSDKEKKTIYRNLFAIRTRSAGVRPTVMAINIGAPPSGSTIGSNAPIASKTVEVKWLKSLITAFDYYCLSLIIHECSDA